MASSRCVRPEVYPLFAATGVAIGICAFQLFRNITGNPEVSLFSSPSYHLMASSRCVRPEVYPLLAATGVAIGICAFQLFRDITGNPEVSLFSSPSSPSPPPPPPLSAPAPAPMASSPCVRTEVYPLFAGVAIGICTFLLFCIITDNPEVSLFSSPSYHLMASSRCVRPEVYPLLAATGVAIGICAFQLFCDITGNPEVSLFSSPSSPPPPPPPLSAPAPAPMASSPCVRTEVYPLFAGVAISICTFLLFHIITDNPEVSLFSSPSYHLMASSRCVWPEVYPLFAGVAIGICTFLLFRIITGNPEVRASQGEPPGACAGAYGTWAAYVPGWCPGLWNQARHQGFGRTTRSTFHNLRRYLQLVLLAFLSFSAASRCVRPEVYLLFAATRVTIGICAFQLFHDITGNPEVRVSKVGRAAGVLDNHEEGRRYAEHGLRSFVRDKTPEIMPGLNKFFTEPK